MSWGTGERVGGGGGRREWGILREQLNCWGSGAQVTEGEAGSFGRGGG